MTDAFVSLEHTEHNANLDVDATPSDPNNSGGGKSDLHRAARRYARGGIPIFPCRPGGKFPAIPKELGGHGFEDATTDLATIDKWWTENPERNIGMSPEDAGWCVVDIDGPIGAATWHKHQNEHGEAPATFTVVTPSGGLHLYYKGSLPSTVGKGQFGERVQNLGAKVDTRGRDGYVLLPPSVIDERDPKAKADPSRRGAYKARGGTFPPDTSKLAEVPSWVVAKTRKADRPKKTAAENVAWDREVDVEEAKRRIAVNLAKHGRPVEHEGSDNAAIAIVNWLLDLPLSEEVVTDLLHEHWAPHFDKDWLEQKVENAANSDRDNERGCDPQQTMEEKYGPTEVWRVYQENAPPAGDDDTAQEDGTTQGNPRDRFRGRPLSYYQNRPDPEFWDDDETLPRTATGAIGTVYGDSGTHKTNVVITKILDAVQQRGARVLYAAGEGSNGVTKLRFPAHLRERGLAIPDLDEKLRVTDSVPLFTSPEEVASFIEANRDFNPDIVVLDTLATAIAGEDENGSRAAAFLTDNGPAGRIKRAFNATLLLPAHSGKDERRGVRGNSGFRGNVDFVLHQEAHESGAIKQTVEKMRDGRDGFSVYFKTWPRGDRRVPVPVKIDKAEYDKLVGTTAAPDEERLFNTRRFKLIELGVYGFGEGLLDRQFAEALVGPKPRDASVDEEADWQTLVERERKALENARRYKRYRGAILDSQVPPGGRRLQWRWFLPEAERGQPLPF